MTTATLPDVDTSVLEDVTPPCDCTSCDNEAGWALTFSMRCEHRLWLMCDQHAARYGVLEALGYIFGCPWCGDQNGRLVKAVTLR